MPICSCDIFFVLFLKLFPFTPISLLISFKPGFSGFLKGAPIVFFTPFFCIQLVEVKISEVNLLISSNLGKINPLVLEYLEEFFLNKFSDFFASFSCLSEIKFNFSIEPIKEDPPPDNFKFGIKFEFAFIKDLLELIPKLLKVLYFVKILFLC